LHAVAKDIAQKIIQTILIVDKFILSFGTLENDKELIAEELKIS
jgi:hypothetical protein